MSAVRRAITVGLTAVLLFSSLAPQFAVSTPAPPVNGPAPTAIANGRDDTSTSRSPIPSGVGENPRVGQPETDTTSSQSPQNFSSETTPTVKVITPEIRTRQQQAERIRSQIEALGDQIEVLSEAYNGASLDLAKTTARLDEVGNRLRWFESELQAQRGLVNQRAVQIYKTGKVDPLEVIVNSKSFREFLVRFNLLVRIGANDANLLERIHLQKRKIEEAKAELEILKSKQLKLVLDLEKKKSDVQKKLEEYKNLLSGVDAETRALLLEEAAREDGKQVDLRGRFAKAFAVKPGSVVAVAMRYLGIPYVWGGETPEIGFDCSGLTRYVYRQFGVDMPHWVPYQWDLGIPVIPGSEQPGDLVFFNNLNHVGIYIGNGYFIHAPRTGDYVKISSLAERKDYMGARRYIADVSAYQ